MKNAIALLTRQRRKVFCEGLLASMTRLGVKASAVAAGADGGRRVSVTGHQEQLGDCYF